MFKNLQAEMARRSLTGRDLAKVLEISEVTWYSKINGQREWKLKEMEQIREALGIEISFEYLFKR